MNCEYLCSFWETEGAERYKMRLKYVKIYKTCKIKYILEYSESEISLHLGFTSSAMFINLCTVLYTTHNYGEEVLAAYTVIHVSNKRNLNYLRTS